MRTKHSIFYIPDWLFLCLILGLVAIVSNGCASAPTISAGTDTNNHNYRPQIRDSAIKASDSSTAEKKLRTEVRQWQGTPYLMGGVTRQGVDCSGFVQRLYEDIFRQNIPRSTALQVKSGRLIEKNQLRAGDLVFFSLDHKGRHVGIYLGQDEFAHASTSKGVTISSLQNIYWDQSFWMARRYLGSSL